MKKNYKIKALITTFWITLISLNIGMSEDWSYDQRLIDPDWQILTWQSQRDYYSSSISLILKIIALAVWIIGLLVVLKTKDKEQRKRKKKVWIIATFWAILISIIYDVISWWLRTQNQQTVYGVMPVDVEVKSRGNPIYPEDTVYNLPEPKTSLVNIVVNLAQWIVPIITFIIWIVSFIRILMTKDKELRKKRIRNTFVVLLILIILTVGISIAARFLNK